MGEEVFTYTLSDGMFQEVGRVTVTVRSSDNDPPMAQNDLFEIQEDADVVALDVLRDNGFGRDVDPDGDSLVIVGVSQPEQGGNATIGSLGSDQDSVVLYAPAPDFFGTERFMYELSDGVFTDRAVITVTVKPVGDGPIARNDRIVRLEDSGETRLPLFEDNGFGPDVDPDGDAIRIVHVGPSSRGGELRIRDNQTPQDLSDDYVAYRPQPDFIGSEAFTYTISDSSLTDQATVTVTVVNVNNDAPVAEQDRFEVPANSSENRLNLLGDNGHGVDLDPDGDLLRVTGVEQPNGGGATRLESSVNNVSGGTVLYTPAKGFFGAETFTYLLSDGFLTATGNVSVTVRRTTDSAVVGETGRVSFSQPNGSVWFTVSLQNSYDNPVVIMQPLSFEGSHPGHVRIRDVGSSSFEYQMEEWDYLDGGHIEETASYAVWEAGTYFLLNGSVMEVGFMEVTGDEATVSFSQTFNTTPIVLGNVQTARESEAVVVQMNGVNPRSFNARLREEEAKDVPNTVPPSSEHASERLGYVAIEPGIGQFGSVTFEVGLTPEAVSAEWYPIAFRTPARRSSSLSCPAEYGVRNRSVLVAV